jgi:hypothetical protein
MMSESRAFLKCNQNKTRRKTYQNPTNFLNYWRVFPLFIITPFGLGHLRPQISKLYLRSLPLREVGTLLVCVGTLNINLYVPRYTGTAAPASKFGSLNLKNAWLTPGTDRLSHMAHAHHARCFIRFRGKCVRCRVICLSSHFTPSHHINNTYISVAWSF